MLAAVVAGAAGRGERGSGQVGDVVAGVVLAVGQQVEPGVGDAGEQGRGPAAAVEAQDRPGGGPGDVAQRGEQVADLGGQGGGGLGHHDQQRVPGAAGDPGLLGCRAGELQPGQVHLLDVPLAEVGPGVPVDVEESQGARAGRGVVAGQRQLQVRGLAGGGELGELAADRLDFRGPVQAQHPAQRGRGDPGGALGAGLAQQRHEHQHDKHDLQAVEPVPEPPVDLPGAVQQPGLRQRRQREQQPGQRVPGARREYRRGALAQQPEPGQRPLGVPGHRVRQYRQRPGLCDVRVRDVRVGRVLACGGVAPGDVARGRAGRAQHAADRGFRHPCRGGDRGLAGAVAVQLPDLRDHLRGQLRGPLRSLGGRDQARDPAAGQRLRPPPYAHRDHPEGLRDLHLGRGLQQDELDCGQPPRRLVLRVPRERGQPVHPHHAAAVRAGDHAHSRGDLRRVPREKRQRHLGQHPGHHPTPLSSSKPFIYYCGNVTLKQAPAHKKKNKRPDQQGCDTP